MPPARPGGLRCGLSSPAVSGSGARRDHRAAGPHPRRRLRHRAHPVGTAQRFPDSSVLAVDLSLTSLAYAARKTHELGIGNIEYAQADILALGSLAERFDVIECAGVLHHLDDPLAGWRILCSLLRPDGVMRIGLYSELARRHVVRARELIAAEGFAPTPDGIRACRAAILARQDDALLARVARGEDFYSLSGCRDLMFHVREHRFTLPRIAGLLADLGLAFIGFELPEPASRPAIGRAFPTIAPLPISTTGTVSRRTGPTRSRRCTSSGCASPRSAAASSGGVAGRKGLDDALWTRISDCRLARALRVLLQAGEASGATVARGGRNFCPPRSNSPAPAAPCSSCVRSPGRRSTGRGTAPGSSARPLPRRSSSPSAAAPRSSCARSPGRRSTGRGTAPGSSAQPLPRRSSSPSAAASAQRLRALASSVKKLPRHWSRVAGDTSPPAQQNSGRGCGRGAAQLARASA